MNPTATGARSVSVASTDTGEEFTNMLLGVLHPEFRKLRHAILEDRQIPGADFDRAVRDDLLWALPGSTRGPEN